MKTPATPTKPPLHQRAPRLWGWALITLALIAAVWSTHPEQLPVSLYKLSLVTLAAVVGYWIDRSLFPYARPDTFLCSDMLPDTDSPDAPWPHELHFDPNTPDVDAEYLTAVSAAEPSLVFGLAMLRRAIIVGCAMLAMGLGA